MFTKRELSTEISNLIISWLVETKTQRTLSTLLTLGWLSATRVQMENTFLSGMERILLVLPDMLPSTLTLVTNNLEEMISKPLATYFFTSSKALCLGKVSQEDQSRRNTPTSKRRRRK